MILFALYDMLACRVEIIKEERRELEKIINKIKDDLPDKKDSKNIESK
ncbi:MAG: hypothetical protein ACJ0IB_05250 [Verrucomicrobiales bacterium]